MRNEKGSRPSHCTICGKALIWNRIRMAYPFCSDACYWVQIRKVGKRMLERRRRKSKARYF